jgi:hypothetical protein
MTPTLVHCARAEEWSAACGAFRDHSYRQLWAFGSACAQRVGAASEHVAIHDRATLLGLADVRIKRVPWIGAGVAYINGGPLVRRGDGCDGDRLRACLAALGAEYCTRRGLVLRVAPSLGPPEWCAVLSDTFAALGFAPASAVPAYRTLVVDLRRPLPDVRTSFEQKWRNGLNRAERNGLTIRTGTGDALFSTFLELYTDLRTRKGFAVNLDATFYARVQRDLAPQEQFVISLAEHNGRPVAGHVGSLLGDTCVYLLGASNRTGLEQKASYLLQWHVLSAARERGCVAYDLGGIDPDGNPGVYHFKAGLGGTEQTAPGPFEWAPAGLTHAVVRGAERVYRWACRMKLRRPNRSAAAIRS